MFAAPFPEQAERLDCTLFFARTRRNSPPHPPFRRVLAGTDGNFGGGYKIKDWRAGLFLMIFQILFYSLSIFIFFITLKI